METVAARTGGTPRGNQRWAEPLARSRTAAVTALRLIARGFRGLGVYDRSRGKRRIRELNRIRVVAEAIRGAAVQLDLAERELAQASAAAAGDGARGRRVRERLAEVTARRDQAAGGLERLGARALEMASHFKDDMKEAVAAEAAARAFASLRASLAAVLGTPLRAFLRWRRRHRTTNALWMLRRRQSRCLRITDAPRTISRGRPPPLFDLPAPIAESRERTVSCLLSSQAFLQSR
jgi:hypothetical protein